jgi:hypothetical protein
MKPVSGSHESLRYLVIANAINDGLKAAGLTAVAFALRDGDRRAIVVGGMDFHLCCDIAPDLDLDSAVREIFELILARADEAKKGSEVVHVGFENRIRRPA